MIEEIKKIVIRNIEEKGKSEGKNKDQIDREIEEVKNAKLLSTLGLNLTEAIQLLKDNNVPVVLTEDDKMLFKLDLTGQDIDRIRRDIKNKSEEMEKKNAMEQYIESQYIKPLREKSDFVCVHKTDYIPKGDRIRTGKESGVIFTENVEIDEEEYEIQYEQERNTVHFCVNGEVTDNSGGNWDSCKYAIIVPLESIDSKQIKGGVTVDLYTKGGVNLKEDSWILCPMGERENIEKQNRKINIIEYEGDNVAEYANTLIQCLGYRYQKGGPLKWEDLVDEENFYKMLEKEGVHNLRNWHTGSISEITETDKNWLNILNEKIKILKSINKLNTIEDIDKLLPDISVQETSTEYMQEMLEYVKEKGIFISNSYEKMLLSTTKIKKDVEEENKNEVITFFEGLQTKDIEEKIVNARLQTILEKLSETKGYGNPNVCDVFINLLKFSYLSQKEETKGIIHKKEECKDIVSNENIERFKKQLIKIMDNPEQVRTIFGEGELRDDYFSYTRHVDSFGRENGYTFSSPQDQKQSYMIVSNDFQPITEPLSNEHEGYISLRYNDNGKIFDIKYRKGENEPKFQMDGIDILEENFFNLIKDTPQKGEFERIYYMLSYPNLCQAIEKTFPVNDKELIKSFRTEAHRLTTKQLGKASINAETLDKQQVSQEIEKWREREEEKTVND